MGRKGRNPVHPFLSCHILMSPQRVVGALSCLTASSMISAFGVPLPPGCVFLTLQDNTCPISFTVVMLITQQRGELARLILLQSLLLVVLVLYSVLWFPLPRLLYVVCYWFYISWPISLGFISFSCLARAGRSFLCSSAPLSSAPACWRARNPVCTTACQFDQIHAAISCHLRTKRDRSLLSDLSHISGGRISIYKGVSYCQACGGKDLNWLTQHLQRYILSLRSMLWTPHMKNSVAWTGDKSEQADVTGGSRFGACTRSLLYNTPTFPFTHKWRVWLWFHMPNVQPHY